MSSFNSTVIVLLDITIESDVVVNIFSLDFPRVAMAQPVVRRLDLVTIDDSLFKDTIIISDTVSPSGNLKSG